MKRVYLWLLPSGRYIAYGTSAELVWKWRGDEKMNAPAIIDRASDLASFLLWSTRQGTRTVIASEGERGEHCAECGRSLNAYDGGFCEGCAPMMEAAG